MNGPHIFQLPKIRIFPACNYMSQHQNIKKTGICECRFLCAASQNVKYDPQPICGEE